MSVKQNVKLNTTIVSINLTVAIQDDSLAERLLVNLNRFLFVCLWALVALSRFCLGVIVLVGDFSKAIVLSVADLKVGFRVVSILFRSLAYAVGVIK